MRHFLAIARITFKDTVRRSAFKISSISFLTLAALSALPFSPGIAADAKHYMHAGVSTLFLGGAFIALMIVPLLLASGRGQPTGEGVLVLPFRRGVFIVGLYGGFAGALLLFFLAGGVLVYIAGRISVTETEVLIPFPEVGWGCLFAFLTAALILMASRFLPYTPALAASLLVLVLGHASGFLPLPLSILFPAMGAVNPVTLGEASLGEGVAALLNVLAFIGLYLTLAVFGVQKRSSA